MAFILTFNVTVQVVAALVIFLFGYVALFVSLIICFAIAKASYQVAKGVCPFAMRFA
jgi:hypothetical protein